MPKKFIPHEVKPLSALAVHIGERLTFLLEYRGVSIKELALETGITRMGIYRILRGEVHVRVDTLERIGKVFGLWPWWFLEGYEHGKD